MRQDCIEAVGQALGRSLTTVEVKNIEDRINNNYKNLARQDPDGWNALSEAERLTQAAESASKELIAQAELKKLRVAQDIVAKDKNLQEMDRRISKGAKPYRAIGEILTTADNYIKGVRNEYFSSLKDMIDGTGKFAGILDNPKMIKDVLYEVYGKDSGNPTAKGFADKYLKTIESMRTRFNRAGGDIGKLDYGYVPQPHDAAKITKAGVDAWVNKTLPLLDRSRYVNIDGTRMNEAQLSSFLRESYKTLSTGGANKIEPGSNMGKGALANRGSDSRQIHFKDADSWLAYQADFGRGTLMTAINSHVGGMARNIGLVESFGPNPESTVKLMQQTAEKAKDVDGYGYDGVTTNHMWSALSGKDNQVLHQTFANVMQGIRSLEVASKLGSTVFSAISDVPTFFLTTGYNKLPLLQTTKNLLQSFGSKEMREYADRASLIADSVVSDANRFAEGNFNEGLMSRMAGATMKLGLVNFWTDALRRGFSVSMMGGMGKLSKLEWGKLAEDDRFRLENKGVTEQDWAVYKIAQKEQWRNQEMLTPESIRAIPDEQLKSLGNPTQLKDQAVSRLLGVIVDESEYAAVNPDLYTRAGITRGTQKGTRDGELRRSILLFKSFPFAMFSRHWERAASEWKNNQGFASKVKYAAGLAVGSTVFGALSLVLKDLKDGKDPRDMNTPKFWAAAATQGGGFSILGDVAYTSLGGNDRFGKPNWMNFAGPVVGSGLEFLDLTLGNVKEVAQGKETHAADEAVRFIRGHTPVVNTWYIKSVLDHAVLSDLQEMLSPGYLSRMQDRMEEDFGNQFYWKPNEILPDRAPDLESALGD